ncbi:MAG: hypothetical protein ACO1RX_00320 [Candidatus Sericytochromatia bacterium]
MKKQTVRICLALAMLCSLPLGACNQPNPAQLVTEPLTVPGTDLVVPRDQNFEVVLPSLGAGASQRWVLQSGYNADLLKPVSEREAVTEHPRQPPPGYAPNRVFEFTALAPGQTELLFRQEPGGDASTERRFQVSVISPPGPTASPAL